jgi:hypothetical protein
MSSLSADYQFTVGPILHLQRKFGMTGLTAALTTIVGGLQGAALEGGATFAAQAFYPGIASDFGRVGSIASQGCALLAKISRLGVS